MRAQDTPKPKFFELRDNYLSVKGGHPRRGDICAAANGEGAEGELHIVVTDSYTYAGRLHRKGKSVIVRFPNAAPVTLPASCVSNVYRITQFFYAQGAPAAPKTKPRTSERVVNLTDWRATRHLTA